MGRYTPTQTAVILQLGDQPMHQAQGVGNLIMGGNRVVHIEFRLYVLILHLVLDACRLLDKVFMAGGGDLGGDAGSGTCDQDESEFGVSRPVLELLDDLAQKGKEAHSYMQVMNDENSLFPRLFLKNRFQSFSLLVSHCDQADIFVFLAGQELRDRGNRIFSH